MTNNYKKGELVGISNLNIKMDNFKNFIFNDLSEMTTSRYGLIEYIIDNNGKIYNSYDIITGHGDKNSKVLVAVKLFSNDYKISNFIFEFNPHNIYKPEIDILIKKHEMYINNLKKLKNVSKLRELKLKRILK
jgi:hypothetical protein